MIVLKILLHGNPNWYLPIEGKTKVNPLTIRLYADQLKAHLYNAAEVIKKLQEKEWCLLKTYGTMYYLEYCKFGVTSEEAKIEISEIGLTNTVIEEFDLENIH